MVERAEGRRELLYGVSVFAHRKDRELSSILDRFAAAPMFVEALVGVVRASGFEVIPTGSDPDHFDVQLVAGVGETQPPPVESAVRAAATRLLDAAGEMQANPSYAGGTGDRSEED